MSRIDSKFMRDELPWILWSYHPTLHLLTHEPPLTLAYRAYSMILVELAHPTFQVDAIHAEVAEVKTDV